MAIAVEKEAKKAEEAMQKLVKGAFEMERKLIPRRVEPEVAVLKREASQATAASQATLRHAEEINDKYDLGGMERERQKSEIELAYAENARFMLESRERGAREREELGMVLGRGRRALETGQTDQAQLHLLLANQYDEAGATKEGLAYRREIERHSRGLAEGTVAASTVMSFLSSHYAEQLKHSVEEITDKAAVATTQGITANLTKTEPTPQVLRRAASAVAITREIGAEEARLDEDIRKGICASSARKDAMQIMNRALSAIDKGLPTEFAVAHLELGKRYRTAEPKMRARLAKISESLEKADLEAMKAAVSRPDASMRASVKDAEVTAQKVQMGRPLRSEKVFEMVATYLYLLDQHGGKAWSGSSDIETAITAETQGKEGLQQFDRGLARFRFSTTAEDFRKGISNWHGKQMEPKRRLFEEVLGRMEELAGKGDTEGAQATFMLAAMYVDSLKRGGILDREGRIVSVGKEDASRLRGMEQALEAIAHGRETVEGKDAEKVFMESFNASQSAHVDKEAKGIEQLASKRRFGAETVKEAMEKARERASAGDFRSAFALIEDCKDFYGKEGRGRKEGWRYRLLTVKGSDRVAEYVKGRKEMLEAIKMRMDAQSETTHENADKRLDHGTEMIAGRLMLSSNLRTITDIYNGKAALAKGVEPGKVPLGKRRKKDKRFSEYLDLEAVRNYERENPYDSVIWTGDRKKDRLVTLRSRLDQLGEAARKGDVQKFERLGRAYWDRFSLITARAYRKEKITESRRLLGHCRESLLESFGVYAIEAYGEGDPGLGISRYNEARRNTTIEWTTRTDERGVMVKEPVSSEIKVIHDYLRRKYGEKPEHPKMASLVKYAEQTRELSRSMHNVEDTKAEVPMDRLSSLLNNVQTESRHTIVYSHLNSKLIAVKEYERKLEGRASGRTRTALIHARRDLEKARNAIRSGKWTAIERLDAAERAYTSALDNIVDALVFYEAKSAATFASFGEYGDRSDFAHYKKIELEAFRDILAGKGSRRELETKLKGARMIEVSIFAIPADAGNQLFADYTAEQGRVRRLAREASTVALEARIASPDKADKILDKADRILAQADSLFEKMEENVADHRRWTSIGTAAGTFIICAIPGGQVLGGALFTTMSVDHVVTEYKVMGEVHWTTWVMLGLTVATLGATRGALLTRAEAVRDVQLFGRTTRYAERMFKVSKGFAYGAAGTGIAFSGYMGYGALEALKAGDWEGFCDTLILMAMPFAIHKGAGLYRSIRARPKVKPVAPTVKPLEVGEALTRVEAARLKTLARREVPVEYMKRPEVAIEIENTVSKAAAPEIAQGKTLRSGYRAQAENVDVWMNGRIMDAVESTALGLVERNTLKWKQALRIGKRPANVDATTFRQAQNVVKQRTAEGMRKGLSRKEAEIRARRDVAIEQAEVDAVAVALDKSGLGDIDRTTGSMIGTKEGHGVADVISKELFEHMAHRAGRTLREQGHALAADALMGTGACDERALVVVGRKTQQKAVLDALAQARDEVNLQVTSDLSNPKVVADLQKRGILVDEGYVKDVTLARNRMRELEIQKRSEGVEGGFEPVTAAEETRILTEVALGRIRREVGRRPTRAEIETRIRGEVEGLREQYQRNDLRTYQIEMGARVMSMHEWGVTFPRHKNILGNFTAEAEAITIRPGMKKGALQEAYLRADQAGAQHTGKVREALGIKGRADFNERLDVMKPIDKVGDVDLPGLRIEAAREGRPTQLVEGDIAQVFFRLNETGVTSARQRLSEFVLEIAGPAKEGTMPKRVEAVSKRLGLTADEATTLIMAADSKAVPLEAFTELVTRKGYAFERGDIGFSEGNTYLGHDGMNQIAQTAVEGMYNAGRGKGSITMGNFTWAVPRGTDATALLGRVNRMLSEAGVTGIEVGVRVVEARGGSISRMYELTPAGERVTTKPVKAPSDINEVRSALAGMGMGRPEALNAAVFDNASYLVHLAHTADNAPLFSSVFGKRAKAVRSFRWKKVPHEEYAALLKTPAKERAITPREYLMSRLIGEIRGRRSLRRLRDVEQFLQNRITKAEPGSPERGYWEAVHTELHSFAKERGAGVRRAYVQYRKVAGAETAAVRKVPEEAPAPPRARPKGPEAVVARRRPTKAPAVKVMEAEAVAAMRAPSPKLVEQRRFEAEAVARITADTAEGMALRIEFVKGMAKLEGLGLSPREISSLSRDLQQAFRAEAKDVLIRTTKGGARTLVLSRSKGRIILENISMERRPGEYYPGILTGEYYPGIFRVTIRMPRGKERLLFYKARDFREQALGVRLREMAGLENPQIVLLSDGTALQKAVFGEEVGARLAREKNPAVRQRILMEFSEQGSVDNGLAIPDANSGNFAVPPKGAVQRIETENAGIGWGYGIKKGNKFDTRDHKRFWDAAYVHNYHRGDLRAFIKGIERGYQRLAGLSQKQVDAMVAVTREAQEGGLTLARGRNLEPFHVEQQRQRLDMIRTNPTEARYEMLDYFVRHVWKGAEQRLYYPPALKADCRKLFVELLRGAPKKRLQEWERYFLEVRKSKAEPIKEWANRGLGMLYREGNSRTGLGRRFFRLGAKQREEIIKSLK